MNGKYLICMLILVGFSGNIFSQTIDENYEVGTWYGFKDAAVSYTFDDNYSNQLDVVVPMFNEFGFNLTLFTFTNSFLPANWEGLTEAAEQGHEIGSHTVTHNNLSDLSDEEQESELADSRATIEENIPGYKVYTIAYPFCVRGNDDLTRQYYIAARGCSGQIVPETPSDFMNISSMIIGTEGYATAEALNGRADAAVSSGGWAIFLAHGLDGEGGYSEISSSEIRGNLEYLSAHQDSFWVESFGNVFKYIRERNAVTIEEQSMDETTITVQVSDTLDNEIYNYPLTVRRELPAEWESAIVTQNDSLVNSHITELDEQKLVVFDAVPDSGDIIIEKSAATGINLEEESIPKSHNLIHNYPNPFNPSTNIEYVVEQYGPVKIEIYNILGKKLETIVDQVKQPGKYTVKWEAAGLVSGTYLYKYQAGNKTDSGMMILAK